MEIGTNVSPDFWNVVLDHEGKQFLVGMEPVTFKEVYYLCEHFHKNHNIQNGRRCAVMPFAVGPVPGWQNISVAGAKECSSLLKVARLNEGACSITANLKAVPVIPIDVLLKYLIAPQFPIRVLAIDAQGFDLHVVSSMRLPDSRRRVANLMLECQDLPLGSPWFLTHGASSCGQAIACIKQHWPEFQFDGCWPNMGPKEVNCGWSNVNHPLHNRGTRHPYNLFREVHHVQHEEDCPAFFTANQDESPY